MGAIESTDNKQDYVNEFDKKYKFLKEITDKRFGEIQIYKNKYDEKYIAKRGQMCQTSEEIKEFIKKANIRKNISHQSIINLIHYSDNDQNAICGDFNKLTIYFEYFFHDLEKEIDRRRDRSEFLTESEMWYLLDNLVSAGYYLEQNNIYHGDYKPSNILLTSSGQMKVADHGILNIDQSSYLKMMYQKEKCFLSPLLLKALKKGQLEPKHDQYKSDVFALGMTILEVADLAPPFYAYDWFNLEINVEKLEELFNHARTRYGDFFVRVLRDMVSFQECQRPGFEHLYTIISPYRQQPIVSQRNSTLQQSTVQFQTPNSRLLQSNILSQSQPLQIQQSRVQQPQQQLYFSSISQQQPQQLQQPQQQQPTLQSPSQPLYLSQINAVTPQQQQQTQPVQFIQQQHPQQDLQKQQTLINAPTSVSTYVNTIHPQSQPASTIYSHQTPPIQNNQRFQYQNYADAPQEIQKQQSYPSSSSKQNYTPQTKSVVEPDTQDTSLQEQYFQYQPQPQQQQY